MYRARSRGPDDQSGELRLAQLQAFIGCRGGLSSRGKLVARGWVLYASAFEVVDGGAALRRFAARLRHFPFDVQIRQRRDDFSGVYDVARLFGRHDLAWCGDEQMTPLMHMRDGGSGDAMRPWPEENSGQ